MLESSQLLTPRANSRLLLAQSPGLKQVRTHKPNVPTESFFF